MKGAFYTGEYRNVFKELGYSEDEIRKRLMMLIKLYSTVLKMNVSTMK